MYNKISFSAIAAMAALSMVSLTACSDENTTSPSNESVVSPGESGDTVQVHIDGGIYSFPACNAEREGTVQKLFIGNLKYGSNRSFKCEQGSWNEVETGSIDDACAKSDVKIGDVCPVEYLGYVSMGGPIRLSCYVYTENGWTKKGADDFYDENQKSSCEEVLNAPKIETECTDGERAEKTIDDKVYHYTCSSGEWQIHDIERPVIADTAEVSACPAESEGMYETVLDTVTVYPDGQVWDRDVYYHCESGEWVETECRDPLEACAGNNEGEYQDVVCSSNPGNPKASKTTWTFKCANNKWEKLSDEEKRQLEFEREMVKADATCNEQYQPEPKLGDVCSITKQGGNVSFGIVIYTLVCYVYTEEGWVAKGSAVMSENTSCEDILNPPAE